LAANNSLKWEEQRRSNETVSPELPTASTLPPSVDTQITDSVTSGLDSLPPIHDPIIEPPPEVEAQQEETIRTFDVEDDDVYSDATNDFDPTTVENSTPWPHIWQEDPVEQDQQEMISKNNTVQPEIAVEGVTREAKMYHPADGYVIFEGKNISIAALKELHPELVLSENSPKLEILFGTKFPIAARSGDIYVRIDQIPHVVYKFNGKKWIVLDKNKNTTYLQNIAYIQYMISRLDIGEYDPDYLTPAEQDEISEYLKKSP
jgi:hypothetical protein